jgi:hypothetical protein
VCVEGNIEAVMSQYVGWFCLARERGGVRLQAVVNITSCLTEAGNYYFSK